MTTITVDDFMAASAKRRAMVEHGAVECNRCCNVGPKHEASFCPICGGLFCCGCREDHYEESHKYRVEDGE